MHDNSVVLPQPELPNRPYLNGVERKNFRIYFRLNVEILMVHFNLILFRLFYNIVGINNFNGPFKNEF